MSLWTSVKRWFVVLLSVVPAIPLVPVARAAPTFDRVAALTAVNQFRQRHRVANLTLNAAISTFSQKWADNLIAKNAFMHSNGRYGENLAGFYGMDGRKNNNTWTAEVIRAIQLWYNEIRFYNFSRPGFTPQTGHFTALVWKATTKVGIAVGYKPDTVNVRNGRVVVVMNFAPAGNVPGAFKGNVLVPRSVAVPAPTVQPAVDVP
jgi:uncharacterized protein YkwD